ncbi:hypothetical protein FOE67_04935, partial [Streptomyces calidiresistens]|nr:hypothetical protein [Streptomyces calidiresistens]
MSPIITKAAIRPPTRSTPSTPRTTGSARLPPERAARREPGAAPCAAGDMWYDADSPLAIAYAHVQEEPPVPSTINAAVPPALDALVA